MPAMGRHALRLSGYAPALPTPFDDAGELDLPALERLCHRQVEDGATALVVCGTTGEAPTLSRAEHASVVRAAVRASHGRIPVIAGAGSNSTGQAIELSRDAEAAGADALLSVVPYYNKPTQAGMCAHFRAVAEIDQPSDHPSRRARAHRMRPVGRDHRAAGGTSAIHRSQGRYGRCHASAASAVIGGVGVSIAVGRRCDRARVPCPGRRRLYFHHLELAPGLCRALYWRGLRVTSLKPSSSQHRWMTAALCTGKATAPVKYALSVRISPRRGSACRWSN